MSTKRKFDVCTARPKYAEKDAVWWHRVGNAVENDKGSITIYLDSVPVPNPKHENKIVMMLFEQRDEDGNGGRRDNVRNTTAEGSSAARRGASRRETENDDDIPF
jgi:hypothetical protein